MAGRATQSRRALEAVAIALPALIGLLVLAAPLLERAELETVTTRFAVRGTEQPPPDVLLVTIDRESLTALDSSWPIARGAHARAIDRLRRDGARLIGYDVEFPGAGRSPAERAQTAALRRSAERAGNVVFAAFAPSPDGRASILGLDAAGGSGAAIDVGYSGFRTRDGVPISRAPVAVSGLPSLSAQLARRAGTRVPGDLDEREAWIAFAGPPGTVERVRFSDLLAGRVPASKTRGRIVLVAATDPGVKDVLPTVAPGGDQMAGGEIQANAVATWLRGSPLRSAPWWLDVALVLLLGLAVPLAGLRGGARTAWLTAGLLAAGFLVAAQVLFQAGVVVSVVAPLVAFALSIVAWLALGFRRADRERNELRRRFAAADPRVVDQVIAGATRGPGGLGADDIIPGYRLVEIIGRGGMGVVYRAVDADSGQPVAVKVLAPEFAGDEEFRRRFEREARITASLEHPNVLPVYASGEADGVAYIVTRLVAGGDLAGLLRRDGPLPAPGAVAIVTAIASALDAAHTAGLVHRDVKPANILLDGPPPAPAYLADFGIARAGASTRLTRAGDRVGTVAYSAPELATGGEAGPAADIYALGCVLFAAIEGRVPFGGETEAATIHAILSDPVPEAQAEPRLAPVIARALARDPAGRFATAGELAVAAAAAIAPAPTRERT